MAQPLPLPMRFPCWVRAVYSWGGETKKDLGFMEGDLIECLNAGDGSWWTGRLRRDRRNIGLFPSNFVEVLEDCYQSGGSRALSPMPQRKASDQPAAPAPAKQEPQKAYRKPFQSYHKPIAGKETLARAGSGVRTSDGSNAARKPFASMKRDSGGGGSIGGDSRSPSPMHKSQRSAISQPVSRRGSPMSQNVVRATSPLPPANHSAYSQAPVSRTGSYREGPDDFASPPPPAPPPHRYATSRVGTPQPEVPLDIQRVRTPVQEPREPGFTPSPLTNAMNDVMQCLEDIHLMKNDDSLDFGQSYPNEHYDDRKQNYHDDEQFHVAPLSRTGSLNTFQPSALPHLDLSMILPHQDQDLPPAVPPKGPISRPHSSLTNRHESMERRPSKSLIHRKSAYELGRNALNRTYTTKTNVTESSNATNHTVASIASAGAFSATSAGSFYRHKEAHGSHGHQRPKSAIGARDWRPHNLADEEGRPETPSTGMISYHTSHASGPSLTGSGAERDWEASIDVPGHMGGLTSTPRSKKSGFFKRMVDSAKTGAATARSTISAATSSRPGSPVKSKSKSDLFGQSFENIPAVSKPQRPQSSHARMYSSDDGSSWVQVRRDINRANSMSRNERDDRAERCQLLDIPVIAPIEEMQQLLEGEEGLDGLPIAEPKDLQNCNYTLVDKNARFADNVPKYISVASLVQGYLCRPYRSDVQRLRSIFTWVAEKVTWEEDYGDQEIDTRRVLSSRRGCSQEIALLVAEMCSAVGIQAEVVQGYLKSPSSIADTPEMLYSTQMHYWNAVVVEGEWRIMDCSLASPSNPMRGQFLKNGGPQAEAWWFLTLPSQSCYTHVPLHHEQQHIVPTLDPSVLHALPCTSPGYFRHNLQLTDFDTSLVHLDNLDVVQLRCSAPEDTELVAEVEAKALSSDADGDRFETGEIVKKRALCQADWVDEAKRWTVKAILPTDAGEGMLKVYAGKKGLMHSIKSNPHSLAFTLPIRHTGQNPPFDFVLRHPTPHAQRHDLYIVTPQCNILLANNTFVFTVRQHPSSKPSFNAPTFDSTMGAPSSPSVPQRPTSAMSMISMSATGSNYSGSGSGSEPSTTSSSSSGFGTDPNKKPAKLAMQSPSGKIIRLSRKVEGNAGRPGERHDGSDWETVIKVGERGMWRALVLADRSARWCVFGEWECV